jgi:hypothetical protein
MSAVRRSGPQLDDAEEAKEQRRARELEHLIRDGDVGDRRAEERDSARRDEQAEVAVAPERPDVDDGAGDQPAQPAGDGRSRPEALDFAAGVRQTAAALNCGMISVP